MDLVQIGVILATKVTDMAPYAVNMGFQMTLPFLFVLGTEAAVIGFQGNLGVDNQSFIFWQIDNKVRAFRLAVFIPESRLHLEVYIFL